MAAALVTEPGFLDNLAAMFGALQLANSVPRSCTGFCCCSRPPFAFIIAELEAHAHKKS